MLLGLLLALAPARAYREARMFKLVWGNIGVSRIARFRCRLRVRRYVGLRVRNMLLTLLTLGLYRPFARVSEYAMKVQSVTLHLKGSVDQLAGHVQVAGLSGDVKRRVPGAIARRDVGTLGYQDGGDIGLLARDGDQERAHAARDGVVDVGSGSDQA